MSTLKNDHHFLLEKHFNVLGYQYVVGQAHKDSSAENSDRPGNFSSTKCRGFLVEKYLLSYIEANRKVAVTTFCMYYCIF